jgi:hypothetical protein
MRRHRARGGRSIFAALLTVALAAGGLVTAASGSDPSRVDGASWNSSTRATAISATVYVSAVDCRAVRHGSYAGQESGVELSGTYSNANDTTHPSDFAGVYTYCDGHKPKYEAEFVTANVSLGQLTVTPAIVAAKHSERLRVAPGDPLKLSIVSRAVGLTLRITNVNTHKTATINAPGLGRRSGWSAGTLPIYASSSGGPELRGSMSIVQKYSPTGGPATVPGPASFPPVVFDSLLVDGGSPTALQNGVYSSEWFGDSGKPVAEVTSPRHGNFISARVRIKKPVLDKKFDVAHVSGTVLIRRPGTNDFERLSSVSQVPNDSYVDVNEGHVQVTLGLPHGKSETGVFSDGEFKLHQSKDGDAVLTLAGGSQTGCGSAGAATASAARGVAQMAKAKKKKKKVQSLWANAHGNFTTKGSAGAAAVLGTRWYTENECGGTYFRVVRDKIKVTAYYPKRHTVIVTQGHSYFAPGEVAAPNIEIAPVTPTNGRYDVQTSGTYSITVVTPTRPIYVDAAVAPLQPSGGDEPFYPDGTVGGVARWRILFQVADLGHFQDWNVGVQVAGKLYVVPLRVS